MSSPQSNPQIALASGALQAPTSSSENSSVDQATTPSETGYTQWWLVERTSLEALQGAPSQVHTSAWAEPSAQAVPLPESDDGQSGAEPDDIDHEERDAFERASVEVHLGYERKRQRRSRGKDDRDGQEAAVTGRTLPHVAAYARTIKALSTHLPHLRNVLSKSSRQRDIKVECYDYINKRLNFKRRISRRYGDDFYTDEAESLHDLLQNYTEQPGQLRLIVAEDLSTELIACIGSSLNISPEVFEEHLLNSGWKDGKYDDDDANTWITHDMPKSYISCNWFRPVKRTLQRPYSDADWETLLNPHGEAFSWVESVPDKDGKNFGVQHESRPTTNILRNDLDLKTDVKASPKIGDLIGWEEKATIWSQESEGCRIILLLLDPLPVLREELSGSKKALERIGVYQPSEIVPDQLQGDVHMEDEQRNAQNEIPRTLVRVQTHFGYDGTAERSLSRWFLDRFQLNQSYRKSKATTNEAAQRSRDPEKAQGPKRRVRHGKQISRPQPRGGMSKLLLGLFGNTSKRIDDLDGTEEPELVEERAGEERIILESMDRCIFEGQFPRGPTTDYDLLFAPHSIGLLLLHLGTNTSTSRAMAAWLTQTEDLRKHKMQLENPLDSLFVIAQRDTLNVIRLIDVALKDIGEQVLDDTLIQQRLLHWRQLLERFEDVLLGLASSMTRFAQYLQAITDPMTPDVDANEGSKTVDYLLKRCIDEISDIRRRTNKSYKTLMANMSIAESKRGIAEAESVTKLTELAFFFIPLTFSASLFSMQIKEISERSISVAAFIAVAIIITICSYAIRLFIRSDSVIVFRQFCAREIRSDAGISPGEHIPTSSFLSWVWHRVGLLTTIITTLVATLVIPIIFLWTRSMNHGFKVIITLIYLMVILGTSYLIIKASIYLDRRGRIHVRHHIFANPTGAFIQKKPRVDFPKSSPAQPAFAWISTQWCLFGSIATIIAIGPVVAIWVRPLVIGTKIGATCAIGAVYIGVVVLIILDAIKTSQRETRRTEGDKIVIPRQRTFRFHGADSIGQSVQ